MSDEHIKVLQRIRDTMWSDENIAALDAAIAALGGVAWTDAQCVEFASVAFRHAPRNLPDGVELNDIRMGAERAIRLPAPPSKEG